VLRLIVPSRFARRQLERAGLASEVIAPFGQPLYLGPPAEPHTLLFLGGGRREKGANELAEALELLDRRGLEWRAIVAGVRLEGRQPFDRLDRERVELHGPARAAEVRSMLARASIAVFPSRLPETFGYAGFEALCAGRPVVAYDSGAVTEWLRPGESGLLAQAGAPASLAEALAELLLDPSRARALGEAGRRQIAENHRRDRHLAELDRIHARGRAG
jgi:glycosyltransferase involved in cell wall biosynthesis